jgi:hypothetical protein
VSRPRSSRCAHEGFHAPACARSRSSTRTEPRSPRVEPYTTAPSATTSPPAARVSRRSTSMRPRSGSSTEPFTRAAGSVSGQSLPKWRFHASAPRDGTEAAKVTRGRS